MKKILHWLIILLIFGFVAGVGYFTYSFALNIDGKKEADTSIKDETQATTKDNNADYEQDKTKSDPNGQKIKLKMSGNLNIENGAWDFICENASVNKCGASLLKITSPDDSDFAKTHPINEYIIITGEKKFNYKIDLNSNNAAGLYLRKRVDN